MSFFTGVTKLSNTSAIPAIEGGGKITKEAALALLHNHDFFLKTEPHYVSHRVLTADKDVGDDIAAVRETYDLPPELEPLGTPKVKLYEVVDHVPNPVWSSSVVSKEEFVDLKDGLWVRIRSPLAVVMETRWTVRERVVADGEGEGTGELELLEDVEISCSKLLLAIVKAQVDNNWKGIHDNFIKKLVEDAKKGVE
ncbi:uncharacterized protein GGS22DRAFT_151650 [Annulohypoxylon maeteangense]|uniref:uncharacterized protein n=1 Tax=Annulohypoxylon maeteangense TaxID=1927788 RepID=UPI002007FADE|nr:uncharacterized protein GGS22DRAFT_151650 [Annulohypoxylon maeteangense]KAI0890713.1 hypothetical protein GGS22DRAFT_151650 [Annulohypoxylon maeteangense]